MLEVILVLIVLYLLYKGLVALYKVVIESTRSFLRLFKQDPDAKRIHRCIENSTNVEDSTEWRQDEDSMLEDAIVQWSSHEYAYFTLSNCPDDLWLDSFQKLADKKNINARACLIHYIEEVDYGFILGIHVRSADMRISIETEIVARIRTHSGTRRMKLEGTFTAVTDDGIPIEFSKYDASMHLNSYNGLISIKTSNSAIETDIKLLNNLIDLCNRSALKERKRLLKKELNQVEQSSLLQAETENVKSRLKVFNKQLYSDLET